MTPLFCGGVLLYLGSGNSWFLMFSPILGNINLTSILFRLVEANNQKTSRKQIHIHIPAKGKRNIIFNSTVVRDMLVPRRSHIVNSVKRIDILIVHEMGTYIDYTPEIVLMDL